MSGYENWPNQVDVLSNSCSSLFADSQGLPREWGNSSRPTGSFRFPTPSAPVSPQDPVQKH